MNTFFKADPKPTVRTAAQQQNVETVSAGLAWAVAAMSVVAGVILTRGACHAFNRKVFNVDTLPPIPAPVPESIHNYYYGNVTPDQSSQGA